MSQSRLPTELMEKILHNLDFYTVIRYCKQTPEIANLCNQNQNKLAVRFASEVGFVQDKEYIAKWIQEGITKNKFTAGNIIKVVKKLNLLYNYMTTQNKTALMYGLYEQIMNAFKKLSDIEITIYLKILQQYFKNQLDSPRFEKFNVGI